MSVRILGIESSCDETAAAVVCDGREILSNVVASQTEIHRKYGGVVPELASREHLRQIVPVVREALARAGLGFEHVDAIGVTQGPGLVGSLLVGLIYGKALALALNKPLIPVNHLEGHVHAVFLEAYKNGSRPELPAICLIVSGGHTLLYEATKANGEDSAGLLSFRRLGGTRDDAAGEAYDKVAKLLALGYPGGPVIDQLADPTQAGAGDPEAIRFASPKMKGNSLDFSFSGLKTAVLYYVREHPELQPEIELRQAAIARGERKAAELLPLCSVTTLNLIASFQRTVVRELLSRTFSAAEQCNVRSILVSGGVAANRELRASFDSEARRRGICSYFPSLALSTDNAAMIAAAAYSHYSGDAGPQLDLDVNPSLKLGGSS